MALDEVKRNRGVLYDPLVADTCVNLLREGRFSFKAKSITDFY
jgi:hypothetical protein